jgi:predicted nuclease with TOPRIM domain
MSLPRRRILRPARPVPDDMRRHEKLLDRRSRLRNEQESVARWMKRLRRAFHAVEKNQARVCRLEREIARLEQS